MKTFIYFVIISILIFNVNSSECIAKSLLISKTFDNCLKCSIKKGCTKCDKNYYINNGKCEKKCSDHCTSCLGSDICTKCENALFIRFRESPTNILCILKDDRMNIDKCSMYIEGNDEFKCVDCEKGYKLNFKTQQCESSPIRKDDIDDIL